MRQSPAWREQQGRVQWAAPRRDTFSPHSQEEEHSRTPVRMKSGIPTFQSCVVRGEGVIQIFESGVIRRSRRRRHKKKGSGDKSHPTPGTQRNCPKQVRVVWDDSTHTDEKAGTMQPYLPLLYTRQFCAVRSGSLRCSTLVPCPNMCGCVNFFLSCACENLFPYGGVIFRPEVGPSSHPASRLSPQSCGPSSRSWGRVATPKWQWLPTAAAHM